MKKTILFNLLMAAAASALTASCDYLDVVPDNVATLDNAFTDRYEAEKVLATCYWGMPKTPGWNENPALMGAMEMIFNKAVAAETSGMQAALGNDSPSLAYINYWGGTGDYVRSLYNGINYCNIFLERIDGVKDLNAYEKRRWIAEVKLIKAYHHFYLTNYYGPMCPLKENMSVNESTEGMRVYRQKVDDCFEYALSLVDEVIDSGDLPDYIENRASELGRFTKAAAYMIKAKMLIYWASPLFNGNTDYNGFVNENGEPFFNQVYDATRWQRAAEACKEAIDKCEETGIRLYQMSDYSTSRKMTDSTRIVNTLRSAVTERWNTELIWGNTSYQANWSRIQNESLARLQSAGSSQPTNSRFSIPLHFVDKFYSKNGVPIEEDVEYDYANRFGTRVGDEAHKYYIKQGETTAAMNFDREPRFYATLGFDRGIWYGNAYENEPEDESDCKYPKGRYGEYSSVSDPTTYNTTGYWPKKLVSLNTMFITSSSVSCESYPFPDMRYADLLLYYAEALNESKEEPDAEVYKYVDMVRERAGLKGVVESWREYSNQPDKPSTKAGMREIIQRERCNEFSCECVYYWDVRRWKTAIKEMNRLIQGWNYLGSEVGDYYTVTTYFTQTFSQKNYLAPIPESDIIKNPQLVQNPGW